MPKTVLGCVVKFWLNLLAIDFTVNMFETVAGLGVDLLGEEPFSTTHGSRPIGRRAVFHGTI